MYLPSAIHSVGLAGLGWLAFSWNNSSLFHMVSYLPAGLYLWWWQGSKREIRNHISGFCLHKVYYPILPHCPDKSPGQAHCQRAQIQRDMKSPRPVIHHNDHNELNHDNAEVPPLGSLSWLPPADLSRWWVFASSIEIIHKYVLNP